MAIRRIVIAACILALSSAVLAQTLQGNIPVGSYPLAIAVNSFTDRIYTLDEPSNQITEIDGVTNTTTAIPLGSNPQQSLYGALAINPFTNKIYAVGVTNNNLFVIDGATRSVGLVPTGAFPYAVAVNPYTGKIYVANYGDGIHNSTVTVVDGVTLGVVHPSRTGHGS
jgi:DNA-binding beta-propeller fold protein YncE